MGIFFEEWVKGVVLDGKLALYLISILDERVYIFGGIYFTYIEIFC
jgi:hypothetical protein